MDAYHAPHQPKYRYWTGLLLFSRAILYIISSVNISSNPGLNLLAVIIVVACLLLLKGNNAYKLWPIDAFESGFYLNLLIFCSVKLYALQAKGHHASLTYSSIGAAFVMFICIICYHVFTESNCSIIATLKNKVGKTAQAQHDGEYDHHLDNNIQLSSDESSQEMSYLEYCNSGNQVYS